MAFNIQSWGIISGATNNRIVTLQDTTFVGAPNVFTYVSAVDTVATIEAANYFGTVANDLNVGDLIYAVGTDSTAFLTVTAVNVYLATVTVLNGFVTGDVSGPGSSTNNDFVLFNGATGKIIKDSGFSIVPLNVGGTNANLTASNGGIFYSTASAGAILAGTATARQMLQSGASSAPAWSTATWPATTTINDILYSSANNVVGQITTANGGVLVTDYTGTGVPQFLAGSGVTGNILQSSAAAAPTWSTATYPATVVANELLYASATNVIGQITLANGSVLVSNATGVPSWLANPSSTGNLLQAVNGNTPQWTTALYPTTTVANALLYSSATNVVANLAVVNNAVLTTTNSGGPVLLALTDGQVIIGSSAGAPAAATLTAGNGVSITNGHNTITVTSNSPYGNVVDQTSTPVTMAANTTYIADDGVTQVVFNVPATAALGAVFKVVGKSAGGWQIVMNTGQTGYLNSSATSVAGSFTSTNQKNCIELMCVTANTTFVVTNSEGVITVA